MDESPVPERQRPEAADGTTTGQQAAPVDGTNPTIAVPADRSSPRLLVLTTVVCTVLVSTLVLVSALIGFGLLSSGGNNSAGASDGAPLVVPGETADSSTGTAGAGVGTTATSAATGTAGPASTPSAAGGPPAASATAAPTQSTTAVAGNPLLEGDDGRPNPSGDNLALGQPASASSSEGTAWLPAQAVDGDQSTRWSSAFSDPQWIRIDLGAAWQLSSITLYWENSYATRYRVETSLDGRRWMTVYGTSAGNGGRVSIDLDAVKARHLRVYGIARSGDYGYSLHEIEVR